MDKGIFCSEVYYILLLFGAVVSYPLLLVVAFVNTVVNCIRNKVNNKTIAGQVAVVTGSGRGFGRDIAIELAKQGCHIAIVDIQEKLAQDTANFIADNYKVKTKAYKIDVGDYNQLVELNNSVTKDLGNVTILINNAGIMMLSSIQNPPPQEMKQMINVNFNSICYSHEIFLPKMKELNYGHIVNISSISALLPVPFFKIYAATKAAIRSLTYSLRLELRLEHKNITATTVMPTFLCTNKRVEKITNLAGIQNILPLVEGDVAAKYVVDGMLRGAREITIPNSFLYLCKVLEFLPSFTKELCFSILLGLRFQQVSNSTSIANILITPDAIN